MRIEIRSDGSVLLDGYVNAVCRDSRPISMAGGKKFIERIEQGAFQKALERAENVDLLLDHDQNRKLGSTKEGNLELFEDNIGLRAICTVNDKDVAEKAKNKQLRGWSFGFYANKDRWEDAGDEMQRRSVEDLDLSEVSIIDQSMLPCYSATTIETRGEEDKVIETRGMEFKAVTEDNTASQDVDYSKYENIIKNLKEDHNNG